MKLSTLSETPSGWPSGTGTTICPFAQVGEFVLPHSHCTSNEMFSPDFTWVSSGRMATDMSLPAADAGSVTPMSTTSAAAPAATSARTGLAASRKRHRDLILPPLIEFDVREVPFRSIRRCGRPPQSQSRFPGNVTRLRKSFRYTLLRFWACRLRTRRTAPVRARTRRPIPSSAT
ncbi:hypothetical protein XM48_12490 [Leucobacter sp. Ag1]|nr:hypothetical protein XM48_12490 [Leucobacter sp. Ag1]